MEYRIKKGIISYNCEHCQNPLESKQEEAGLQDKCPICGGTFIVPGREELMRHEAEQRRLEEAKRIEKERADREWHAQREATERRHREAAASQQNAMDEERARLAKQTRFMIPAYDKSKRYIISLQTIGKLWIVLAVIVCVAGAGFVANFANNRQSEQAVAVLVLSLCSCCIILVTAFMCFLAAELVSAFRDMAINSWRIAISCETANSNATKESG